MISALFLCEFEVSKLIKYGFYGTLHELPLSSFVQDHANQKQKKDMTTLEAFVIFKRIESNDNSSPMRRQNLHTQLVKVLSVLW